MSSGVGRGRGWLNLKQNQNSTAPAAVGNLTSPTVTSVNLTNTNITNTKEQNKFEDFPDNDTAVVNRIKQLDLNDDGILFNQKIKYIVENWKTDCQTSEEVELVSQNSQINLGNKNINILIFQKEF